MNVFGHDLLLTKALLSHLEEKFPDKLPRGDFIRPETIAFLQGQQQVIDYLKAIYETTNETEYGRT